MRKFVFFIAILLACLQAKSATPPATVPPQKIVPTQVYDVYRVGHEGKDDDDRNCAGIGDVISIKAHGLLSLFNKAYPKTGPKQEIRLFLGNRQIGDLVHLTPPPNNEDGEIQFRLERTVNNDKIWSDLLGKPGFFQFFDRRTQVSIGLDGGSAENSTESRFQLVRIRECFFWPCLAGLVLYFVGLIRYGKRSNMLRDSPADLSPLGLGAMKPAVPPYSLGKVQMAFWFSIILASYFFIWLITGNYELITAGSLILIGIGAGTALGAVSIDNSKAQDTIKQVQALELQQSQVNATIAELTAQAPPAPSTPGLILYNTNLNKQISDDIKQLIAGLTQGNSKFINDILTDANGVSFHRLQMFIWTLVLGLIFVYTVWATLTMPDFSPTLLTMQGITAGTYLGFKFPEKQV